MNQEGIMLMNKFIVQFSKYILRNKVCNIKLSIAYTIITQGSSDELLIPVLTGFFGGERQNAYFPKQPCAVFILVNTELPTPVDNYHKIQQ